jgi:hypothetical protein
LAPRRNRRRAGPRVPPASARRPSLDDPAIDALYGLEPPVDRQEPGSVGEGADLKAAPLDCPYCGERVETTVDVSAGSAAYIEDCQVCCQPIEVTVVVDDGGALIAVSAGRGD